MSNIEIEVINGEAFLYGSWITEGKRVALPWGSVAVEQRANYRQLSVNSSECALYTVKITEDGIYVLAPRSGRRIMKEDRSPLDETVRALMLPVHVLKNCDGEIRIRLSGHKHDGRKQYTRAFCSAGVWLDLPKDQKEVDVTPAASGVVVVVKIDCGERGRRVFLEAIYSFPGATPAELAYAYFRAVHELEYQPALDLADAYRKASTSAEWMFRHLIFGGSQTAMDGFLINGTPFRLSDEGTVSTPPQSIIRFLFNKHGSSLLEGFAGSLQKPYLTALAEESEAVRWVLGEYSVETVDTDSGPVLCIKDAMRDRDIVDGNLQNQGRIKNSALQLLLEQFPLLLFKLRAAAPRRQAEAVYPLINRWMLQHDYAWAGFSRSEGVVYEPMYPANEVVMIPALDERLNRVSTLLSSSTLNQTQILVGFLKAGDAAYITPGAGGEQSILMHLPEGSKRRLVMVWCDNEHRYAVKSAAIERRGNELEFSSGGPENLFMVYVEPDEDNPFTNDRVVVTRLE